MGSKGIDIFPKLQADNTRWQCCEFCFSFGTNWTKIKVYKYRSVLREIFSPKLVALIIGVKCFVEFIFDKTVNTRKKFHQYYYYCNWWGQNFFLLYRSHIYNLVLFFIECSVEHLSMKCCEISDGLLAEVASHLAENKSLIYLNLSCNKIGDGGVNSLATSLRLNRTLLSLALTNNHIGDAGALSLANVRKTTIMVM